MQLPKSNITREEHKALEDLRKDKKWIILAGDKRVSMVVMDREDYMRKVGRFIKSTNMYVHSHRPYNQVQEQVDIPVENYQDRRWD